MKNLMMVLACVGFMASCASTETQTPAATPTAAHDCECGDSKGACADCNDKGDKSAQTCECGKEKPHDHKVPKSKTKTKKKS